MNRRSFFAGGLSMFTLFRETRAIDKGAFQLQDAELIRGASKMAGRDSSAASRSTKSRHAR